MNPGIPSQYLSSLFNLSDENLSLTFCVRFPVLLFYCLWSVPLACTRTIHWGGGAEIGTHLFVGTGILEPGQKAGIIMNICDSHI